MGAISVAVEWAIDQWAVVSTALAFIYNATFRKHDKHLAVASLTICLLYAAGHFLLGWINGLGYEEQVYYRHSSRFMLYALGLFFYVAFVARIGPTFTSSVILSVFILTLFLQLSLHIDRNLIGLNKIGAWITSGELIVNKDFSDGYWLLWDIYTITLNISTWFLVAFVLFGENVKEFICSRVF